MQVVIDIECNSLVNPTKIWLIVCKDIANDKLYIWRNLTEDEKVRNDFIAFGTTVTRWIGHNLLGYDYPVLHSHQLLTLDSVVDSCVDTLIVSKLVDFTRQGHSIEQYGQELGLEKVKFSDWTKWSQQMEDYCVRDVDICHRLYLKYSDVISDVRWASSLRTEHAFQMVVNSLHSNGFGFNRKAASNLLGRISSLLKELDEEILKVFPPKFKAIREVTPKVTKHGTLSRTDFRFVKSGDLSEYNGGPFVRGTWVAFNPASHKQVIEVLNAAGWKPTDRTATHIDAVRNKLDLTPYLVYGWRINENNLGTLPDGAPKPARTLAKRILLESRRRTLTEWAGLLGDDDRIHGQFYGIGAWTHRMAHQRPNTANIPTDAKLYGSDMRALWCAPKRRLLVGVDAEGIQLRIFAHYIDDAEFTKALVEGDKKLKTDPHSYNQRVIGPLCRSRQDAKRFIYALLLGAGINKLAEILGCTRQEADDALSRILTRYEGFARLKRTTIPADARRGWFTGLDGRRVKIPGDAVGERKHLCMSGYLQNGEAIIMKRATLKFSDRLAEFDSLLVNLVHDEWQTETPNNMSIALQVAAIQSAALKEVGEELGLRCPLAGSYWNEDKEDYTIGHNWTLTH